MGCLSAIAAARRRQGGRHRAGTAPEPPGPRAARDDDTLPSWWRPEVVVATGPARRAERYAEPPPWPPVLGRPYAPAAAGEAARDGSPGADPPPAAAS